MNRSELAEKIATEFSLSKAGADRIVDSVFNHIVTAVKKGEGFAYAGFGSFKVSARAARKGRNPATGEDVKIPAMKVPKFSAGSAFKAAVDPKAAARRAEKAAAAKGNTASAKAAAPKKAAVPGKKAAAKRG